MRSREALPGQVIGTESEETLRSQFHKDLKLHKQGSLLKNKGTSEIELNMEKKAMSQMSRREEEKQEDKFLDQIMAKKSMGASCK